MSRSSAILNLLTPPRKGALPKIDKEETKSSSSSEDTVTTQYGRKTTVPITQIKPSRARGHSYFNRASDSKITTVISTHTEENPLVKEYFAALREKREKTNFLTPERTTRITKVSAQGSPLEAETTTPSRRALIRSAKAVVEEKEGKVELNMMQTKTSAAKAKKTAVYKKKSLPKIASKSPLTDSVYSVDVEVDATTLARAKGQKRKYTHGSIRATDFAGYFGDKSGEQFEHSHGTAHSHGGAALTAENGKDKRHTFPAPTTANTARLLEVEAPVSRILQANKRLTLRYQNTVTLKKDKEGEITPIPESETVSWSSESSGSRVTVPILHAADAPTPAKQLAPTFEELYRTTFVKR